MASTNTPAEGGLHPRERTRSVEAGARDAKGRADGIAIAHHLCVATRLEEFAEWVLRPQLPERPARPRSSYFICGTPRSGSWFLCGLLASTGVAGRPHEWFWGDPEEANRRAWGVSDFSEYVARVRDAGTTPNGV